MKKINNSDYKKNWWDFSRETMIVTLVSVVLLGIILWKSSQGVTRQFLTEYTIEVSEDGFSPDSITIQKYDRINFKSTRGVSFWPAANEHPTHSTYSEFDPLRPIQPNESWGFTFKKKGTWEFHDHLYPFFKGNIVVK